MPSTQQRHLILESENKILAAVADGNPVEDILNQIIIALEEIAEDVYGSILGLDLNTQQLQVLTAPNLPAPYNEAIDGLGIGDGVGSCGTAAYRGTPIVVEDILSHPFWKDFKDIAADNGLRACWSTPIFSSRQEVLGTFACYYKEPKLPSDLEWEVMTRLGHLAAIALERDRQQKQHQERLDLDYLIIEQAPIPVLVLTRKGQIIRNNHAVNDWFDHEASDLLMSSFVELFESEPKLSIEQLIESATDPNLKIHARIKTPERDLVHVEISVRPIAGERYVVFLWPGSETAVPAETVSGPSPSNTTRQLSIAVAEALSQSLTSLLIHHALLKPHVSASAEVSTLGKESLKQIGNAANQIQGIASQLSAFAGHLNLELAEHDCDQLMSDCLLAWRKSYGNRGHFELHLGATSTTIHADAGQFHEALTSLVRYCIGDHADTFSLLLDTQDSKDAGRILIALRIQHSGLQHCVDESALFEPFQNGAAPDLKSGLGLAPIRSQIQMMKGTINARCPTESAIQFNIELPTVPTNEITTVQTPETNPPSPPQASTPQILVSEDNEAVRLAIDGLLRASGFKVHSVADGEAALNYALTTETPPALLISDIRMPGIDGKELSMRLRKENPALEIILISGHTAGLVSQEWLEKERITFLPKPFAHTDLIAAVNRSLETYHHAQSPA